MDQRVSAPTLTTLRTGVRFVASAAASFVRLEKRLGRQVDVNSTYRDYDLQMRWHNESLAYLAGKIKYPGHAFAVHPDYSDHCKGVGLDSDDWPIPGFVAIAAEHGWIRTAASDPTERHHFQYQPGRDKFKNQPAGVNVTPVSNNPSNPIIPITSFEDDDMRLFHQVFSNGNQAYVCSMPNADTIVSAAYATHISKITGQPAVVVNEQDWDVYAKMMKINRDAR
jgi:hypothetical protein